MRLVLALALTVLCSFSALANPNWNGVAAPDFKLQDQAGAWRSLKEFRGQWLVLYFYPKDKTSGCSREAAAFEKHKADFAKLGTRIVGVSLDDVASHKDFAETLKLSFPLLADTEKTAAKAYDVLFSLGPVAYTERQTFVIDPEGIIRKHYPKVDPDSHATELLAALAVLTTK